MAVIMCSASLHRAIAKTGGFKECGALGDSGRLGDWAGILAGSKLVVAIDERTCLTLVLPLRPIARFQDRFAAALRRALLDCGVSPGAIERECRALRAASFVRRRHPGLVEALAFAEIEALAHVDGGQGEESVQDMLNDYSYSECPASCPKEAAGRLLGRRPAPDHRRSEAHSGQAKRRGCRAGAPDAETA